MIICASNKERKFKIVTRKVENDCCNVFVGDVINVSLCSLNSMDPYMIMPCDWSYGWPGNNNVILNEAEYGCDIFLTDDIYGLCYTDDSQIKEEYQKYIRDHPLCVKARGERDNVKKESPCAFRLNQEMHIHIYIKPAPQSLYSVALRLMTNPVMRNPH